MTDYMVEGKSATKNSGCRVAVALLGIITFGVVCGIAGYYVSEGTQEEEIIIPPTEKVEEEGEFYIGVWKNDVTGPVSEVNMMGYAKPGQNAGGLHTRLYSRAFIIADKTKSTRVVFVSIDYGMTSQLVKLRVIEELRKEYGDLYTERNVVLSGSHTHSAPGGYFEYALFEATSKGTVTQSTDVYIEGIVRSIKNAHNRMRLGNIYAMSEELHDANINRSPAAYLRNPEEERAKYEHDTDHEMTLLRLDAANEGNLGIITWFPVHLTSMNSSNLLINSDNKGRASMLFEKMMRNSGETITGKESFVAAFASSNLGDVSPNTMGPKCTDTGRECDFDTSTCRRWIGPIPLNLAQLCVASGPGKDMFESTDIIGTKQFQKAAGMFNGPWRDLVTGPVSFGHQYVDMSQVEVTLSNGSKATTCKPALGYSFAAGCTDGAGAFTFRQGITEPQAFWEAVRAILIPIACSVLPDEEFAKCQSPKPVLFPTGYMDKPYQWHPHILDVQLLRIGQILIAAVPGEFSTMGGRRLRDAIKQKAVESGMPENTRVVIAGLSNVYSHYMVTYEEYQAQRYEGASTLFGPHTHAAYVQLFKDIVGKMVAGEQVAPGTPPEMPDGAPELLSRPLPDYVPEGKDFGDVIVDANSTYNSGDVVKVKFYGANPRHNVKLGGTYLEVQHRDEDGSWTQIFRDADWETKFIWEDVSKSSSREENVVTAVIDMVAVASGVKLNLDRARELFDRGELNVQPPQNGMDRESLQEEMLQKGVLEPHVAPRADFGTAESHVTIEWDIPAEQPTGTYRILYHGDYYRAGEVNPFTGTSKEFQVKRAQ